MLQPSTIPFTNEPSVAQIAPKIGDKVSMLANVRESLTKRYQLAKSARIEAERRLDFIERVRNLRNFIKSEVNYMPMYGMADPQLQLLNKIAYTEQMLVKDDLWGIIKDLYESKDMARKIAATYKIQTWSRMVQRKHYYKYIRNQIILI